jgi:DNA-binding NtrC family response regulator
LAGDHSNTVNDGNNASILVVDDEYDIVNLIKRSLEIEGLRVCSFTDPFVALDHFNSDPKDQHSIVISDIKMPGMNGFEFVKKAKDIDKQIKIILMTAYEINQEEFHNVLSDIKVEVFLQKPFHIQQLNDVIDKISTKH